MNVLQPSSELGDHSLLENQDDSIYDINKLTLFSLYESEDLQLVGGHVSNSYTVVPSIIDQIITASAEALMEKYLASKLNSHAIKSINSLINMVVTTEFILYDTNNSTINDDEEPPALRIDSWSRSQIETKEKLILPPNELNIKQPDSPMEETRKAFLKAKEKAKKFLADLKEEIVPTPVDLSEPMEFNPEEDQKRNKKEEEYKRKEEEAHALKHKEDQAMKQRLAFQTQESKNKNFTYGYDGTRIPIVLPKIEKLPQQTYVAKHWIQEIPKELPPITKKQAANAAQKANKVKKPVIDNDRTFAPVNTAPPIFDSFTPAPGVSLIESGRTKVGPKLKSNVSISDGILTLSSSTPKEKLMITRSDYLQMTRGGNLSRQNLSSTDNFQMTEVQKNYNSTIDPVQKSSIDSSLEPTKTWSPQISTKKEVKLNDNKDKNLTKSTKMEKTASLDSIKVGNMKIYNTLLQSATDDLASSKFSLPQIDEKSSSNKHGAFDNYKKTPIDEFNLEILNSKDWGKNIVHASSVNPLRLPKPHEDVYHKTLGMTRPKLPRERTLTTDLHLSKSHPLSQSHQNLLS